MRKLAESDVEFSVECLPEDRPVRGSFVTGDDAKDREIEDRIIEDYENGNDWAWCLVRVTAKWEGFKGEDYLGGCSYENEKDFIAGGYYEGMKSEALADLNAQIETTYNKLREII